MLLCAIINAFDCYRAPLIMSTSCDNYAVCLSSINLSTCSQYAMEMVESIGWFTLGFAPTLVAMKVAWKIGKRQLVIAEAEIH